MLFIVWVYFEPLNSHKETRQTDSNRERERERENFSPSSPVDLRSKIWLWLLTSGISYILLHCKMVPLLRPVLSFLQIQNKDNDDLVFLVPPRLWRLRKCFAAAELIATQSKESIPVVNCKRTSAEERAGWVVQRFSRSWWITKWFFVVLVPSELIALNQRGQNP